MILTRKSKTAGFDSVAIDKMFSINGGSGHIKYWIGYIDSMTGNKVEQAVYCDPGCTCHG